MSMGKIVFSIFCAVVITAGVFALSSRGATMTGSRIAFFIFCTAILSWCVYRLCCAFKSGMTADEIVDAIFKAIFS